jgi:NAD(P)-dependent dehydrogenase (short-subunit alcohol dehydrogenase family)
VVLNGEVAVVTGSASGIGRATAILMAQEGASVVVADINGDGAEQVAAEIMGGGGKALAHTVDLEHEEQVEELMSAAREQFGKISVLHNNAAAVGPDDRLLDHDIANLDQAVWNRHMNVTLRSQFFCCKYAIPSMLDNGKGAIVNMSSGAAIRALPWQSAYSVAKAGVLALSRSVAAQYGKRGIRCNTVIPGLTLTPSVRDAMTDEDRATFLERTLSTRLGEPEDLAQAVVFLASDAAAYVNGAELAVDGGITCHLAAA